MSNFDTRADVFPNALMTEAELTAWEALPPGVQLERLRAAIDEGANSGVSDRTMDEILLTVLARHSNADL